MRLSIVIVNYNVKYFLDQVHLIANDDNVGFAKANNQALRLILDEELQGEGNSQLVLLLNPDTVVENDTFRKCVAFYASHPDCGGLGVKMINGEGTYLKESKRGFPTPEAAFFKISGLIRLFPHNRRIAAYYMGHLDDEETNPIDILPGAFLMVSRAALEKVGLLDESYFMYGEDIDFSWRIKMAGFENYYYPATRIIHYKGESTKHGSMNYVYTFYNAMSIFVQHYFSDSKARWFNLLLRIAIWARASVSWLKRVLHALVLPVTDFAVAFGGFVAIKHIWATHWAANAAYYPPQYTWIVIPIYILVLMLCSWLYGGYTKPVRLSRIIKGMAIGSALLLVFYSLLDESQRYSRVLLLLGCAWTLLSSLGIRGMLSLLRVSGYNLRPQRTRSCIIIGGDEEVKRVRQLYRSLGSTQLESLPDPHPDAGRLDDAIRYYNADEVVFCSKDLSIQEIISLMTHLGNMPGKHRQVEYKIAPTDSNFIIGSNSIHRTEDLYTEELRTIADPLNRRNKRLFDIISSMLLILFSPILLPFQRQKQHYFAHCWQVLVGKKSWVGVAHANTRSGIFAPEDALPRPASSLSPELKQRLHLRYLRNYKLTTDLQILFSNIFNI